MTYQIAICDDNAEDIRYVETLVKQWAGRQGHTASILCYPSAEAFLFAYEDNKAFDILLLDIEMSGMDGVELARRVRFGNHQVQIIFITGYTSYIADGYEVEALHYLLKPVNEAKLSEVLSRAVVHLARGERVLLLDTPDGSVRLPIGDIHWAEVQRNYVTIHTAVVSYTVKQTLSDLESQLDEGFFRTGRSFLVNLKQVRRVSRSEVLLADGSKVPLARGYYDKLNQALIAHF